MEIIIGVLIVIVCVLVYKNNEKEKQIIRLNEEITQNSRMQGEIIENINSELKSNINTNNAINSKLKQKEREIQKLRAAIEFQRNEKNKIIHNFNALLKDKREIEQKLNSGNVYEYDDEYYCSLFKLINETDFKFIETNICDESIIEFLNSEDNKQQHLIIENKKAIKEVVVDNKSYHIDGFKFIDYAGNDFEKWQILKGKHVIHKNPKLGNGIIKNLELDNGIIRLYIQFNELVRIPAKNIEEYCKIKELENIKEFVQYCNKRVKEEQNRNKNKLIDDEFIALCRNYNVEVAMAKEHRDKLFSIMIKVQNDEIITDREIEWLKSKHYNFLLAKSYLKRYSIDKNPWDLIATSKYFRLSNKPYVAASITKKFSSNDNKIMAALMTTRGAALKDLQHLDEAMQCATKAIELNSKSPYPYNLAGAIQIINKNIELAINYFDKALELGSDSISLSNKEVNNIILCLDENDKKRIKEYLISKDSKTFGWLAG